MKSRKGESIKFFVAVALILSASSAFAESNWITWRIDSCRIVLPLQSLHPKTLRSYRYNQVSYRYRDKGVEIRWENKETGLVSSGLLEQRDKRYSAGYDRHTHYIDAENLYSHIEISRPIQKYRFESVQSVNKTSEAEAVYSFRVKIKDLGPSRYPRVEDDHEVCELSR